MSESYQTILYSPQGVLPDLSSHINTYLFKTIKMLHEVYGTSPDIKELSLKASFVSVNNPTGAYLSLHDYKMSDFVNSNDLPSPFPYLSDRCATIIPSSTERRHGTSGIMEDLVEAIRYATHVERTISGELIFNPPSTAEIQTWMSTRWPDKYPVNKQVARGWRNSVNQCLTHGQGWNFITYSPRATGTENGKIKRHLLFERAFNGSYIVGSGQCKGLNDQKTKAPRKKPPSTPPSVPSASSTSTSTSTSTPAPVSSNPTTTSPVIGSSSTSNDLNVYLPPSNSVDPSLLQNHESLPAERSLFEVLNGQSSSDNLRPGCNWSYTALPAKAH